MQVLSQLSYSPTASRMVPRFEGDAILRATMPEHLPADPKLSGIIVQLVREVVDGRAILRVLPR